MTDEELSTALQKLEAENAARGAKLQKLKAQVRHDVEVVRMTCACASILMT